jgi:P27 family predicted phage terminase small subunit
MSAPRKSDALHKIHGTDKSIHDRAADSSQVPAGRPHIPRDIGPGLKRIFKNLCKLLQERRTLTNGDAELIRLYCFQYERHEKNVALLREEGELVTYFRLDSNGQSVPQVKINVRLKVCTDAERQMAAILSQLGLAQIEQKFTERMEQELVELRKQSAEELKSPKKTFTILVDRRTVDSAPFSSLLKNTARLQL